MPAPTVAPSAKSRIRSWERDQKLRALGYENYDAYIHSPEWAEVKARYRKSLRPQDCGLCGTSENIQIHHLTYDRVGKEELADLVALCRDCHSMLHALERRGDIEGLDFEGLIDHARAEKNKKRLFERLGSPRLVVSVEQRDQKYRSMVGRMRNHIINANRREIDISEEMAQFDAMVKALGTKLEGIPKT